jgi:hypothetical protein
MTLMTVRLELARTAEHPHGNPGQGYRFVIPLDEQGRPDAEGWRRHKDRCRVHQIGSGLVVRKGWLRHLGHGWCFDYERGTHEDDQPFFKLDRHVLAPGNYVSITEDKVQRPFKIVSVTPANTEEEV